MKVHRIVAWIVIKFSFVIARVPRELSVIKFAR